MNKITTSNDTTVDTDNAILTTKKYVDDVKLNINNSINELQGKVNANATGITTLGRTVETLQGKVGDNTGKITTLQGTVGTLQGTVGTLEGTVGTLEGKVNELYELKNIITINSIKLTKGSYTVNITLNNNGTLSINGTNNNTPYSLNVDVTGEVNVMPV